MSLKPNITELIFALGKGDELVGVTTYCDYPPQTKALQRIADYMQVNIEGVMALKPTLIFASMENSKKGDIEFLRSLGLRVELLSFDRLSSMEQSVLKMADILKVPPRGQELIASLKGELATLKAQGAPKKVLVLVGLNPLVAVGGQNFLDDLLTLMGAQNVMKSSTLRYPTLGLDQIVAAAPEVIFDLTMGSEREGNKPISYAFEGLTSIPAVKNHRIYALSMDLLRAPPRLLQGLRQIHDLLQSGENH